MNNELLNHKLIPVVIFKSVDEVKPVLSALCQGGVFVAEICFRTECAYECLKLAVKEFPNMLIGAGTVITDAQALSAIKLGAKFIVSPGLSEEVSKVCGKHGIVYVPGVVTPTEIIKALDLGLYFLKFFPADAFGGLKTIKALASAFPQVKFMPTGGIDNSNLKEYISEKSVFAIGGSWLVKGDIVKNCLEANKIIEGK